MICRPTSEVRVQCTGVTSTVRPGVFLSCERIRENIWETEIGFFERYTVRRYSLRVFVNDVGPTVVVDSNPRAAISSVVPCKVVFVIAVSAEQHES